LLTAAEADQDRMMVADTQHRPDDTLALAQKCAERLTRLADDPAVSKEQLRLSSQFLANVAQAYMNSHRYEDAVRLARRQVELARSAGARMDYIVAGKSVLANALRQSGDLQEALRSITEARTLAESMVFPNQTARASLLYALFYREGLILGEYDSINLDRPSDALESFRRALDVVDRQASLDPNDASVRDRVATSGRALADVLVATDPQRALDVYDHVLVRLREVKASTRGQRQEALTLARSSYALRLLGRSEEAGRRIQAALTLLRAAKDYPHAEVPLGEGVELALRAQADQEAATGQPQRALESYRDLLAKVLAARPNPREDLRQANDLSRIYRGIAALAGSSPEGQAAAAQRLDLWRFWEHKLPGNVYIQRQLTATL
jgi:tetratricopeptide (TPR) repeat protein